MAVIKASSDEMRRKVQELKNIIQEMEELNFRLKDFINNLGVSWQGEAYAQIAENIQIFQDCYERRNKMIQQLISSLENEIITYSQAEDAAVADLMKGIFG